MENIIRGSTFVKGRIDNYILLITPLTDTEENFCYSEFEIIEKSGDEERQVYKSLNENEANREFLDLVKECL